MTERRSKYGARRTEHNGRVYASAAEARRAAELELLQRAGEIKCLEYQPRFPLVVSGRQVGTYVADFRYVARRRVGGIDVWDVVTTEDVKGVRTPVFRLKAKLVFALYGVTVREVTA